MLLANLRMPAVDADTLAGHYASGYNFQVPQVSPTFRVKVLFFGRVRELAGHREEAEELPEGATIADLFERYTRRFPLLPAFALLSWLRATRNSPRGIQNSPSATKLRSCHP